MWQALMEDALRGKDSLDLALRGKDPLPFLLPCSLPPAPPHPPDGSPARPLHACPLAGPDAPPHLADPSRHRAADLLSPTRAATPPFPTGRPTCHRCHPRTMVPELLLPVTEEAAN
ncbi:hypothetical protein GQ55_4G192900 [Panicum hallii var. hallii]|uniref:Uncharacterized protein n=1 Tax=Panicum hallii var. hallii TaxID=1504633 RepID=A0A2T7DZ11_9POAL|nr:hypothetical protein GQ55_4G192900 [Panicum hallii var. hallii]